jgi:hypothetical protein
MSNDEQQRSQGGNTPAVLKVGPLTNIDISQLPADVQAELVTQYARGSLDIAKKAQELHVNVGVLKETLDNLARTTKDVSDGGNAVTITHSQTTPIGRTEIKMGNTEEAKSGKLSSSQSGQKDLTPIYIVAAIAAIVVIAFMFLRH